MSHIEDIVVCTGCGALAIVGVSTLFLGDAVRLTVMCLPCLYLLHHNAFSGKNTKMVIVVANFALHEHVVPAIP